MMHLREMTAEERLSRSDRLASILDFLDKEGLTLAADALRVETELDLIPQVRVPLEVVFDKFEAGNFQVSKFGQLPRVTTPCISGTLLAETAVGKFNPTCVAWATEGDCREQRLVVGTVGRELLFFCLQDTLQLDVSISDLPSPVLCVAWRQELVVVGCMGGELAVFRVTGNQPVCVEQVAVIPKAHGNSHVLGVAFSPCGTRWLSYGRDASVAVYAAAQVECVGRVCLPSPAAVAAWTTESEIVVAETEGFQFEFFQIPANSQSQPAILSGKTHMLHSLRDCGPCLPTAISMLTSADLFVAAVGKNVHVYRPHMDSPIRTLHGASEGDGLVQLAMSADGAFVYVGTSEGLSVYETHSGHRVYSGGRAVRGMAVSRGRIATVAFDKKLRIFS